MTNENYPPRPEETPPQYSGPYDHDPRDPVTLGEMLEVALDDIELEGSKNEPVTDARNRLRELLDPKTRGERKVSDEELAAALSDLARALRGDKDEGMPGPQ
jgi:hypothetical protein